MKLQDVLEKFKQQGNYAVNLFYGEGTGCDDLDVPQDEREITIVMSPVGYLGEVRKLVKTNLKELENFDLDQDPTVLHNPPERADFSTNGVYVWGTDSSMEQYQERKRKGSHVDISKGIDRI